MLLRFLRKHAVRFWQRVTNGDIAQCWLWNGHCAPYGSFKLGCKETTTAAGVPQTMTAHRVAWLLTRGALPTGYVVCHSCDNPRCCNPHHLFAGPQQVNIADKHAKGRAAPQHGEHNPRAKLTLEKAAAIRAEHATGVRNRDLARKYNVSPATITAITKHGRYTEARS